MSIYVLVEAWKHTRAVGTTWDVITCLGDAGSREEGISWVLQEDIRGFGRADDVPLRAERGVRDAISWLIEHNEIEVRWIINKRGKRQACYRVILGKYGRIDVNERGGPDIPFQLSQPFSRPADIAARKLGAVGDRLGSDLTDTPGTRPANTAGQNGAGLPADSSSPDRQISPGLPAESAVPYEKDLPGNNLNPTVSTDAAAEDTSFATLTEGLKRLGVSAKIRLAAMSDPARAEEWLRTSRKHGKTNPAGMFVVGFESGDWPTSRDENVALVLRKRYGREESLRRLVAEGAFDNARDIIDDEWQHLLTRSEQAELHELVDELINATLPVPITDVSASEAHVA